MQNARVYVNLAKRESGLQSVSVVAWQVPLVLGNLAAGDLEWEDSATGKPKVELLWSWNKKFICMLRDGGTP